MTKSRRRQEREQEAAQRRNLPADARALFANPSNDITIPHYGRVLRPTDDLLIRRGQGIELYRECKRDGRVYTCLQKRRRALIARNWTVEPASEEAVDRRAAELVKRHLERMRFDRVTLDLLDATLMGFSVGEVLWERDGFEIVPAQVKKIDQRRIAFDVDGLPRLLTHEAMMEGLEFPARKAIVHRFDEDDPSDPYAFGLGRILFWHVLFKREGVSFWLKALERFAVPLPVGKYPFGTLPQDQRKLLDALTGAVAGGALVVPAGTELDFAKAAVSGTLTHDGWVRYWDEQTAETVLGETLSTNIGSMGGSRAAAAEHREVKDEIIDADADLISDTYQDSLIRWMVEYNVPDAQPPAVRRERPRNLVTEEAAKQARAARQRAEVDTVFALRSRGFAPADLPGTLTEIMDRPVVEVAAVPEGGDLGPKPPNPTAGAARRAIAAFAEASADPATRLTGELLSATEPERREWLGLIRAELEGLLAEGGDLGELPDRVADRLPVDRMGELIGQALLLAEVEGRAELLGELAGDGA